MMWYQTININNGIWNESYTLELYHSNHKNDTKYIIHEEVFETFLVPT